MKRIFKRGKESEEQEETSEEILELQNTRESMKVYYKEREENKNENTQQKM